MSLAVFRLFHHMTGVVGANVSVRVVDDRMPNFVCSILLILQTFYGILSSSLSLLYIALCNMCCDHSVCLIICALCHS